MGLESVSTDSTDNVLPLMYVAMTMRARLRKHTYYTITFTYLHSNTECQQAHITQYNVSNVSKSYHIQTKILTKIKKYGMH